MKEKFIKEALNWIDDELHTLRTEISSRNKTVEKLEKLSLDLKQYESLFDYKEKYEEAVGLLEQDKIKLIELHNCYTTMEAENKNLKTEVKRWQSWFFSNKDVFNKLFASTPPINPSENTITETSPISAIIKKKKSSPKKIKKKK